MMFSYIRPYSSRFLFSVFCSVLNKIFDLMPPVLVGWIIDSVRGDAPHWIKMVAKTNDPFHMAIFLSALATVIFAFESIFQWGYQYGFTTLAQKVQHDIRMHAYAHLQEKEMAFFEDHRLGDTLAILNDDVNQLERFLNNGFNELLQLLVLFSVSSLILFSISWQLALVGFLPIPLIISGGLYYRKTLSPLYKAVREKNGILSSQLENNVAGIGVIKSFTAESLEYDRIAAHSHAYQTANEAAIRVTSSYTPLIRMVVVLGFAGVLLMGSYWILNGSGILTVGQLVLFAMMTERLLWPFTGLGVTVDNLERSLASANRLFGFLAKKVIIQSPVDPIELKNVTGAIRFSHVSFSYSNRLPILTDLDFEIKAGQTVGVAGTTGSGKSTLVKLLLRFYDPVEGDVLLEGHSLRRLSLQQLRQSISLVSQDVYLFHGSIFDNIAYSTTNATLDDVIRVAKQAQLHDFVTTLPDQYNTTVGEKGIKLSGGQRQRLSIARALLKNAPIMIFDEATSSVDTETEKAIQTNLNILIQGKTAIIIAHRLSTIRHADRILVINRGQLAESGTHDELVAKSGIYADLWHTQIGE